MTLPDRYNGLGFKSLIYMVFEILDFQKRWADTDQLRPLVHLIAIEEPEAHLHAQLQQVFITQIRQILQADAGFRCQMIATTHSPHIIYHAGFDPIRYFRRIERGDQVGCSEVLNLSTFDPESAETLQFLTQYVKLTHSPRRSTSHSPERSAATTTTTLRQTPTGRLRVATRPRPPCSAPAWTQGPGCIRSVDDTVAHGPST